MRIKVDYMQLRKGDKFYFPTGGSNRICIKFNNAWARDDKNDGWFPFLSGEVVEIDIEDQKKT